MIRLLERRIHEAPLPLYVFLPYIEKLRCLGIEPNSECFLGINQKDRSHLNTTSAGDNATYLRQRIATQNTNNQYNRERDVSLRNNVLRF